MSATISVDEAQAHLKELIDKLAPGEELVITDKQLPVAMLVGVPPKTPLKPRPAPGLGKEMITFVAPDFDAPLDCMKE